MGRGSADREPEAWPAVLDALADARQHGFLGPDQAPDAVARHAAGFAPPIADARAILDLGSGGGVPGLVLAALRPDARMALVDASVRRTDWLRRAVSRLGWAGRVEVVTARAEALGHDPRWRGTQDAVVARSFAPPLVTAECAAGLLRPGGRLVVSEPPAGHAAGRWPSPALAELGMEQMAWADHAYAVIVQCAPCPEPVPRGRVVRGHTS